MHDLRLTGKKKLHRALKTGDVQRFIREIKHQHIAHTGRLSRTAFDMGANKKARLILPAFVQRSSATRLTSERARFALRQATCLAFVQKAAPRRRSRRRPKEGPLPFPPL